MNLKSGRRDLFVPIYPDELAQFGTTQSALTDAYVYGWIVFRCRTEHNRDTYERDGRVWWKATVDHLANELGLGRETAKKSLGRLRENGFLEGAQHFVDSPYDRTMSYSSSAPIEWVDSPSLERVDLPSLPILPKEVEKETPRSASDQSLQGFDEFWKAYPRKEAKDGAKPHFKRIVKEGASPDQLIAASQAYASKVKAEGTDKKYIRKAYNWLRDGDWEDLIPGDVGADLDQLVADGAMGTLEEMTGMVFEANYMALQDLRGDERKAALIAQWKLWVEKNRERLEAKLSTP